MDDTNNGIARRSRGRGHRHVGRIGFLLAIAGLFAPLATSQVEDAAGAIAPDPVVGTFADQRLTAMFTGKSRRYTGAFAIGGQLYPVTARKLDSGELEGKLESGSKRYDFRAALEGDVLVLRSGAALYRLRRKPPAATQANPLASTSGLLPGFRLHRHAIGFSLQVPETWKVSEAQGGLVLTPPDVKQEAWGPAEMFVVSGAPAEGVQEPHDPQVRQYLEGVIGQTLGTQLRRVGDVDKIQAGPRPGAIMTWKGTYPGGQGRFRARAYVVMMNGYGVTLSCVGPTLQLKRRDAVLRKILATFGADTPDAAASTTDAPPGKVDQRLVGRWYRSVYRRSALPGGINTAFHQTMLLAPDGKLSWVDQTVLSGQQRAGQASSGWTFSGIPESQVHRGTWSATGNTVHMTWQGGAAVYSLHVQGASGRREMLLTPQAGGDKELWTEYAN
ncbi:MAG: hypothetical protein GY711_19280 [bacterium]|nr:hypothetical protein [bacterium]